MADPNEIEEEVELYINQMIILLQSTMINA